MSSAAIALLVISLVVVWGGLAVSIAVLSRRPERTEWPQGMGEDGPEDGPGPRGDRPVEHDT